MGEPCLLMKENPTAEAIARLIYEFTKGQGFPLTQVRLWETETSYATYDG
jgi:6-pyruvoyltetrahydropterin/6-carboxytetrahydropterin synthase